MHIKKLRADARHEGLQKLGSNELEKITPQIQLINGACPRFVFCPRFLKGASVTAIAKVIHTLPVLHRSVSHANLLREGQ